MVAITEIRTKLEIEKSVISKTTVYELGISEYPTQSPPQKKQRVEAYGSLNWWNKHQSSGFEHMNDKPLKLFLTLGPRLM